MTEYQLLWLDTAIISLEPIQAAIEDVSPSEKIAKRLIKSVYDSVQRLIFFPRIGQEINEVSRLRRLVVGNDSVFYRVFDEKMQVQIERIMDHHQDTSFLV